MQLLDDAVMELHNKGWIGADDAYAKANDKGRFREFYKKSPRRLHRGLTNREVIF